MLMKSLMTFLPSPALAEGIERVIMSQLRHCPSVPLWEVGVYLLMGVRTVDQIKII